jgi:hypothetical protein
MTNAALQEYMQDIMKRNTVNETALDEVNSSMARVWKEARERLQPGPPDMAVPAPAITVEGSEPHSGS